MKNGIESLKEMTAIVDAELFKAFESRAGAPFAKLYHMLEYFMGYRDQQFARMEGQSGKRFRPSLCLLIADMYGARDAALEAAVAIELFHNFTLVHDDVEDCDEYRRDKPTVWKIWGINHAINSGDVQSLMACEWAARAARHEGVGCAMTDALLQSFIEVGEGQYLDFELADSALDSGSVVEARYFLMIEKKSGVLVRIAAEAAGLAARRHDELGKLREYGLCLGMAFQLADDYQSVWSTQEVTGKDTHSDIREHKRTLPFLAAYAEIQGDAKRRLGELYSLQRQLSEDEIREALAIINMTSAHARVCEKVKEYSARAKTAAASLDFSEEKREVLMGIVDALVPPVEVSERISAIVPAPVAL